jgi:hypothetical protein
LHRARNLMKNRVQEYCDIAGTTVHEFAGHRCDAIIRNVTDYLRNKNNKTH